MQPVGQHMGFRVLPLDELAIIPDRAFTLVEWEGGGGGHSMLVWDREFLPIYCNWPRTQRFKRILMIGG